jgi:hypothetical protein
MKKIILLVVIYCNFFVDSANAQNVGISNNGAVPNASAMLDIVASDKGLLVPRFALSDITVAAPVTSPALSLIVYNTFTSALATASNNVVPGFYYWDGAKWVAFSGSGSKDWALLGNAGTVAGTNFLGTTDNVDLVFKVNNVQAGRLTSNTNNNSFFGYESGLNNSSTWNAFFGSQSGKANTSGGNNVGVGFGAMRNSTTGSANTFIGNNAGANWVTSIANTAIGNQALQGLTASTGSCNTALGFAAGSGYTGTPPGGSANGLSQLSGSYNTYVGYSSSGASTNTYTNSTAIGAFSQATASDVLVLGSVNGTNGASSTVKVGVGTTAPTERLEVQGSVKIVDGSQGATKVLMSDAVGKGTWTDIYGSNNQYAEGSTDISINTTTWTDMTGMSITFTPKHTAVYIYMTASGDIDVAAAGVEMGFVKCRVTNSTATTIYGKSVGIATDYDDVNGGNGAWTCSIVCRVTGLTVGTSTTLKVQWARGGTNPGVARCFPLTHDYAHRALMKMD